MSSARPRPKLRVGDQASKLYDHLPGGDLVTLFEVYVGGEKAGVPKWPGGAKGAKAILDPMMAA